MDNRGMTRTKPYYILVAGSLLGCLALFMLDLSSDPNDVITADNILSLLVYFISITGFSTLVYRILGEKMSGTFRFLITFLVGIPVGIVVVLGFFHILNNSGLI